MHMVILASRIDETCTIMAEPRAAVDNEKIFPMLLLSCNVCALYFSLTSR